MTEPREVLHTRRSILSLAFGLFTAGCAATQPGRSATAANGFPYPADWCWRSGSAGELGRLGKIIMSDRNPYCVLATTTGATPCDATNTATWPKALTDETTWKVLTEFDFQPDIVNQKWPFSAAYSAPVTRSMRIPYLIGQGKAKKKNVKVGRENLLVGYEYAGGTSSTATPWGTPDSCQDSIGELGQFITDNMMRNSDTNSLFVPNWFVKQSGSLEEGVTNATWYFRRSPIVVDFSFRFPVATQGGSGSPGLGWIYVGYEGGGSY